MLLFLFAMPISCADSEAYGSDGLGYLNDIKNKIKDALDEDNSGMWHRGDQLHSQATMKFVDLCLFSKKTPSKMAEKTIDILETFLYDIATLEVSEIYQDSEIVIKNVQTTNNQLGQMARAFSPKANDAQFLIKASQFVAFVSKSFLPEFQISPPQRSLFNLLSELISYPIAEYPFISGVASTLAAVWAYGQLQEDVPSGSICTQKDCSCDCHHKKHTLFGIFKKKPESADTKTADEYLAASQKEIDSLPQIKEGEYTLAAIPVPQQSGATCTYHTVANACSAANALLQRKELIKDTFKGNTNETIQVIKAQWVKEFNKHGEFDSAWKSRESTKKLTDTYGLTHQKIEELKTRWGKATLDQGMATALDQGMATALTTYVLGEQKIDTTIFNNIHQDDFYFTMMDYRQHLAQRNDIDDARKCLEKLSDRKALQKVRDQLVNSNSFYTDDGTGHIKGDFKFSDKSSFTDCAVDVGQFNSLRKTFVVPRNGDGKHIKFGEWTDNWLAAIHAYQQGKTLVLGWLSYGGTSSNSMGHWTTVIIVPDTKTDDKKPLVYHLDSFGTGNSLPTNCAKFLHDCINYQFPTKKESRRATLIVLFCKYGAQEFKKQFKEHFISKSRRSQPTTTP